jgi:hypothetical protein
MSGVIERLYEIDSEGRYNDTTIEHGKNYKYGIFNISSNSRVFGG